MVCYPHMMTDSMWCVLLTNLLTYLHTYMHTFILFLVCPAIWRGSTSSVQVILAGTHTYIHTNIHTHTLCRLCCVVICPFKNHNHGCNQCTTKTNYLGSSACWSPNGPYEEAHMYTCHEHSDVVSCIVLMSCFM